MLIFILCDSSGRIFIFVCRLFVLIISGLVNLFGLVIVVLLICVEIIGRIDSFGLLIKVILWLSVFVVVVLICVL